MNLKSKLTMLHEVTLQPIQNTQSAHSRIQFQIGNMKLLLLSIIDLKLKDVMFYNIIYIKKIIKISSDHKLIKATHSVLLLVLCM